MKNYELNLKDINPDLAKKVKEHTRYIITHNIIDNKEKRQRSNSEKETYPLMFKLYDDDKELYFEGYSKPNQTEWEWFAPLDRIGASYGCTEIHYRNAEGKFEAI